MEKFKGIQIVDYVKSTVNYFNLEEIEKMKSNPSKYKIVKKAMDTGELILKNKIGYFAMDTNFISCSHCNGTGKIDVLNR